MNRDTFSQLPNSNELQGILAAEIKRNVPTEKEGIHYIDFAPLIKVGEHFGIDVEVMTRDYNHEDLNQEDIFAKGKLFAEKIKRAILNRELSLEDIEVLNQAYQYLSEEDPVEDADMIFVFGAKTPLRIEKAVELYKEGLSGTIMVSGRGPFYGDESAKTEAEIYAQIAVDKGIPKGAIFTEDKSMTIPDNVRASLNILDERGMAYDSVILVNSPYTQRRGWAHFKKYLPDTIKLIRVNSSTGEQYKHDTWYTNPTGIDVVLSEYFKAKVAASLNTL